MGGEKITGENNAALQKMDIQTGVLYAEISDTQRIKVEKLKMRYGTRAIRFDNKLRETKKHNLVSLSFPLVKQC